MELCKARLRRSGLNTLLHAVHPGHGLAWTDGQNVYLSAIRSITKSSENERHLKIGKFDEVLSLAWSNDQGLTCYLCIAHDHVVSIWLIEGAVNNISCKQIRKLDTRPLPQGCLWSPYSDVLCLLGPEKCTFYYSHLYNKANFALPPVESGRISCGTWSKCGQKLFVGLNSIIMIYTWQNLDNLKNYSTRAWKLPGLQGRICALAAVSTDLLLCSVEQPLQAMCTSHDDIFQVPGVMKQNDDDDIVVPQPSPAECLLNLTRKEQPSQQVSQLVMVSLENDTMKKLNTTDLPGLLVPDLLFYHRESYSVLVGNNNQNKVYYFSLNEFDKLLEACEEMELEKNERSKGLCCVVVKTNTYMMIMAGNLIGDQATLPSSSLHTDYDLRLRLFVIPGAEQKLSQSKRAGSIVEMRTSAGGVSQTDQRKSPKMSGSMRVKARKSDSAKDKLLGFFASKTAAKGSKVVDMDMTDDVTELEVEKVDFDQVPRNFKSVHLENLTNEEWQTALTYKELPAAQPEPAARKHPGPTNSQQLDDNRNVIAEVPEENDDSDSADDKCRRSAAAMTSSDNMKSGTDDVIDHSLPDQLSMAEDPSTPLDECRLRPLMTTPEQTHDPSSSIVMATTDPSNKRLFEKARHSELRRSGGSWPSLFAEAETTNRAQSTSCSSPRTKIKLGVSVLKIRRTKSVPDFLEDDKTRVPAELAPHVISSKTENAIDVPLDNIGHNTHHDDVFHQPQRGDRFDRQLLALEADIQLQNDQLELLKDKLDHIQCLVEKNNRSRDLYQDVDSAEMVDVVCKRGDEICTQSFLLDNRRLKLSNIQAVFDVKYVQLVIDDDPVVVCANEAGFIPLRFLPGSTINITGPPAVGLDHVIRLTDTPTIAESFHTDSAVFMDSTSS